MVKRKTEPQVVIIDDNPISIMGYAEEYPEQWKKICGALKEDKKSDDRDDQETDEKKDEFKLDDYIIKDPSFVLAIVPLKLPPHTYENKDDDLEVGSFGKYAKYDGEIKLTKLNDKFKPEIFILSNTRYSMEYLIKTRRTAKAFTDYNTPEFYLNTEDGKIKENRPCIIKYDNLVFILAPRVENDE